jgi:lysophospholipase L1-like esterase
MLRLLTGLLALVASLASAQEDFGALARFADENAALGPPRPDEQRVVFLGDSITQAWSDASPQYFARNPSYIERGISGQTTPQMLLRFRSDVVALEPAVVVILAGTNDIAGNTGPATNGMIEQNIASMSEIAAANGIRVVLASILPTDDYPWRPGLEPAPRIVAINEWLENYAEDHGHIYLDYYSRMVDDAGGMQERFTTDGVHVTVAGYAVMELLADAAIDEALNAPRPGTGQTRTGSDSNRSSDSQSGSAVPLRITPVDGCARTSSSRRPIGNCD